MAKGKTAGLYTEALGIGVKWVLESEKEKVVGDLTPT